MNVDELNNQLSGISNDDILEASENIKKMFNTGGEATVNGIYFARCAGIGSMNSNIFGFSIIDIADYTNTNKYKTMRSLLGYDTNSAYGQVNFASALWMSTAAISSISISMVKFGILKNKLSFSVSVNGFNVTISL